jgi:DNA polymerase-3 subunit epsilon/ATP-dependent DNA helicase DinG
MSRIYVAVDLETTGLNADRDAILEIGAVKFKDERVLDTFHSLINPGRRIPYNIVELTGISQTEADAAPSLFSQLPRLARFVGNHPVIGHNVSFDLGFLRKHNVLQGNDALDTWELARVLVPHADRYSLGRLAEELEIEMPATHRALDDARVTHALFHALYQRALNLPSETLKAIIRGGQRGRWKAVSFFDDALRATSRDTSAGSSIGAQLAAQLERKEITAQSLFARPVEVKPLKPVEEPQPVDADEVAALLERDGALARRFAGYEYRPEQIEMLRAVVDALNRGDHLLVEAGTGTGKSLAYLLPAVYWGVRNRERVVVSTNTINLQQQLIDKDVPEVQELLPFKFKAVVLKGRGHYLCAAQFDQLRRRGPRSPDEARMLAKILVWLPNTLTGEDEELSLSSHVDRTLWRELSAEFEGCNPERCSAFAKGRCFFYRARRQAEGAHLIIVNHALLLSDIAVENRVLPPYEHLIVDEAQHLENATTRQLSFEMDRRGMTRLWREVGYAERGRGARGLLGDVVLLLRSSGRSKAVPTVVREEIEDRLVALGRAVRRAEMHADAFFDVLARFVQEFSDSSRGRYARRLRVDSGLRYQPGWTEVEIAWDNVGVPMEALTAGLEALAGDLMDLEPFELPDMEDVHSRVVGAGRRLTDVLNRLNWLVFESSDAHVCWLSAGPQEHALALHVAPLHVGALVEEHLFHKNRSIIMTSATLRVAGHFDFIRERLHAWETGELAVGSPFDYAQSTLVYLVNDISEPVHSSQPGYQAYQQAVETGLVALVEGLEGRTMALFTSYHQLRTTARAIAGRLGQQRISVLEQGDGSSRRQLLENFKSNSRSVLLGTRSFWEGVDIPGEALSCLAIIRLPFGVPTDPVFRTRAEQFDNPFFDYFVPEAVLRFLQGFGRLIRTRTDRGVVAVFDKRLLSKSYGPMFLDSLPGPTVQQGPLVNLPQVAARWIEGQGRDDDRDDGRKG